jgi:ABC-type uncharacterized transport system auxiliary subunit
MKPHAILLAVLATFVLTGCGSSPTVDYYTLAMEPSGRTAFPVNVRVDSLQTTEALTRSRIMIASSPTRVEYYATASWVAGVGELVRRKLQAEFGEPQDGRPVYVLSGTVTACEQVDGADGTQARLEIDAIVRGAHDKRFEDPLVAKTFSATVPAPESDPDSIARALTQCAETIASEIAAAIAEL